MRVLHDALRPADGTELEFLVGTTFTLDLLSLISIPLSFVPLGAGGDDDPDARDPLELLAAVERTAERIVLFHEPAKIPVPKSRHGVLLPLLERSVVARSAPIPDAFFHPKLWAGRYRHAEAGGVSYRVVLPTRNLTPDRSWDTLLVVEGVTETAPIAANEPLARFLRWLAGSGADVEPDRAAAIETLAAELERVQFVPPSPFESIRFHVLGVDGTRVDPIVQAPRSRLLVVSPFLGDSRLQRLFASTSNGVLVSRPEQLARVAAPLENIEVLCLDDRLEPESDDATPQTAADGLVGLHAKVYLAEHGSRATLWTGSANATDGAIGRNVEILAELRGTKTECGIDAMLGDGSRGTLRSLLVPATLGGSSQDEDDPAEAVLERVVRAVVELPLVAMAAQGDSSWSLELRADEPIDLPVEIRVGIAPLMRPGSVRQVGSGSPADLRFDGLDEHEVSGLFVVEVQLLASTAARRTTVARWPLIGEAPDRLGALVRHLVTDRGRALAFIRLFLGTVGGDEFHGGNGGDGGEGAFVWGAGDGSTPLFELFVRTLSRDPGRLAALERWMPDLLSAMDDPDDLRSIWEPIRAAREALKA